MVFAYIWDMVPDLWGSSEAAPEAVPRAARSSVSPCRQEPTAARGGLRPQKASHRAGSRRPRRSGRTTSEASTVSTQSGVESDSTAATGRYSASSGSQWSCSSRPTPRHGCNHAFDQLMCRQFLRYSGFPNEHAQAKELVIRTFGFLRQARYSVEDICSVSAHASVYFRDVYGARGAYIGQDEAGHIMVVCFFLAHSYCLDDVCTSHRWHRKLLADYCTSQVFETAIMHLLKIRGFRLRITDEVLVKRYKSLYECAKFALAS